MSVSILEALMGADINITTIKNTGMTMLLPIAHEQLHNAVTLLDKGYSINDEVEPLLEEYGAVENVPEK